MRYLINVIDVVTGTADGGEMAAIDAFNEGLQADGYWVLAAGVAAPSESTVIDNRAGRAVVTNGPLLVTTEYVAGFWIVDVPDGDTALRLATEGSRACNRKVELRPFLR